jgi:glycosyltransferase involved in cell wall biosynthesis
VRRVVSRSERPVVLWLYDAASAGLLGCCNSDASIYDCVDDHAEVSGDDRRIRELVAEKDREAARRANVVITTTTTLFERHRATNPSTYLVPNVGDYEHFAAAASRSLAAAELVSLPRPVLGFTGNVTAWKVDFDLLHEVATRRPSWSLVLVGPARADAAEPLARLTALSNVRYLGAKPYADVPSYVAGFDVGLCPYRWNDAMRSGFPLKLYEYLAAGKPVVACGNPDVAGMEPDVRVVHGSSEFVAAVTDVLALDGEADRRRRTDRAAANTWESRTSTILDLVDPLVAS